jgi:hypothetical protein
MVLQPQDRLEARGATRVPTAVRMPSMKLALWGGLAFVLVTAALGNLIAGPDLFKVAGGYLFALVMLSLVPLTGYAGQISLAQMTFTGIGAVAMAAWGASGSPIAVVASVLLCAVVGAIVALPALRLSGIYLALATAAFGAPALRLHFLRRAQLPRVCGRRGRHLHHRRLHRQHLRAVQSGGHVRRRFVPAPARLPRMHQLICGQLPHVSQPE